jgi:cytoskeletal protein CcmA (bactofilin family)
MGFKAVAAGPTQAIPTYLAAGSTMNGQITTEGDVDVAGHFVGTIIAGHLTIFAGGSVNGDVTVQTLLIEGGYVGKAEAGAVRLGAQSNVQGQLTYRELEVSTGAKLNAKCRSQHQSGGGVMAVVAGAVAAAG